MAEETRHPNAVKVLAAARKYAEEGYTEGPNNDTIFGKRYGMNNQPWCAMFVSGCFDDAGVVHLVAASTKKGRNIATEIIRLPRGGPINELVKDSADHMRPFAFSKCLSATTAGIIVWAVLSRKTSAKPKRNAVIKMTK